MVQVVTIPFDYEKLPASEREHVVPICIPLVDPSGQPIPMEWFEKAVAPVYRKLLILARWRLGDAWCASELAEHALYALLHRHGAELCDYPARRLLREAFWMAADLKAGGSRADRNRRALEISTELIKDSLVDPTNYPDRYVRDLLLDTVEAKLERDGLVRLREVYALVRLGHTWPEIAKRFGEVSEDVLKRQFYRWTRRERAGAPAPPPRNARVGGVQARAKSAGGG